MRDARKETNFQMAEDAATPDMPGATPETAEIAEAPETTEQPTQGLPADKLAELNRTLREERNQWKREAREAKESAEALQRQWDEFKTQLGVDKQAEFDPKAEFDRLRREVESERTERLRADVARAKNVDPAFVLGNTEEKMRDSADAYLADVNRRIEEALRSKNVPAGPPASTVTASEKIAGPQQITSPEELKRLSPKERVQAYKDGRLSALMGKS